MKTPNNSLIAPVHRKKERFNLFYHNFEALRNKFFEDKSLAHTLALYLKFSVRAQIKAA
ncbi:hypothetical protein B0O79_2086 [Flavobacteriaceae bacterium MAR_2009_75]|nr:hypothetical protein B0O79_2086 [Flavobacteriaceae bacterium MAR_2009_75]